MLKPMMTNSIPAMTWILFRLRRMNCKAAFNFCKNIANSKKGKPKPSENTASINPPCHAVELLALRAKAEANQVNRQGVQPAQKANPKTKLLKKCSSPFAALRLTVCRKLAPVFVSLAAVPAAN